MNVQEKQNVRIVRHQVELKKKSKTNASITHLHVFNTQHSTTQHNIHMHCAHTNTNSHQMNTIHKFA